MSDVSRIERSSRSESSVPSPIDGIETPVFNLKLAGTDILRNWGMWGGGGRNEGLEVHLYKGHFFPADQVSDLETPHRGDGGGVWNSRCSLSPRNNLHRVVLVSGRC